MIFLTIQSIIKQITLGFKWLSEDTPLSDCLGSNPALSPHPVPLINCMTLQNDLSVWASVSSSVEWG